MQRFLFTALAILGLSLHLRAQTFSATVNQLIPDDNTVISFPIVVSGLQNTIDSLFGIETACLNMNHTWDSDMEVVLEAPDGTRIILFSGVGGDQDNFTNTCLAGTGTPITSGTAPFTGTWKSQGPLGNINNGQNPNGTWLLHCRDMVGADQGFLIDWSITFGSNPAQPNLFTSSNLPIIKLTTLSTPISNDPKVPVHMQIIDRGPGQRNYLSDTNYAYEGRILAEWQGFSGPSYPKKNYDFDLIDDQNNKIDTTLLGLPSENDWILKAEYLDHSLIKNQLTYTLARRMGRYAPRTAPCEVFLDGMYIGYYTLTEKVKRDANRLDIARLSPTDTAGSDLTGGYIIEMNINGDPGDWNSAYLPINSATCTFPVEFKHVEPKSADILPVQHNYIRDYVDNFEDILNGPNYLDPQAGYRSQIDVSTFIDFLIVNEFSVNYDSYGRSTYMYKEKDTDGGKLKIGPPWDYDRAYDYNYPYLTDGWVWLITHSYWPFPFWWDRMYSDPDYRHQLACRWLMLRQDILADSAFTHYIDATGAHLTEAATRNFELWPDLGGQTYQEQLDSLKSFSLRRLAWIDATLAPEGAAPPPVQLPADTTTCPGAAFDASFLGAQYSYNWQPGPDSALITFTQPGIHTLQVTDAWGCYTHTTIDVTIAAPDPAFSTSPDPSYLNWSFIPAQGPGTHSWDFGDGATSTQASPTHSYTNSGVFTVTHTYTDPNGCSATTSIQIGTGTLLSPSPNPNSLSVSPVPFSNTLHVQLEAPLRQPGIISLHDALGREVITRSLQPGTTQLSLPTDQLPAGAYLLRLQSGPNHRTRQVVKE